MLEFKVEKVNDRITRIFGFCTEIMYLVEGEEKAALLDTGSGFGSLKACVESLTDKEVVVLVTHGHVDHALGAEEFSNVYMSHEDDYIYAEHSDKDFRLEGLDMSSIKDTFSMEDYIPSRPIENFKDLKEGDSFDLGGVHIDVYAIAGHTRGSLAFLIREDRVLLTGDACNLFTFMFQPYSTTIETYARNLETLIEKTKGKYDKILISHGDGNGYVGMMEDVLDVCKDIMKGTCDDIPFEFKGEHGLIAKNVPEMNKGNIVYNKNQVFD